MTVKPSELPPRRAYRTARGFTLIELMTVVVIIGIVAVIATPTMVGQLRERRSASAAQEIALLYSGARMRAMGRGSAVMVTFDKSASTFRVLESIQGANARAAACRTAPGRGCLTTNWTTGGDFREVGRFDWLTSGYEGLNVEALDPSGTSQATFNVCFTPVGRTFSSIVANTSPTTSLAGVATVTVDRGTSSLKRRVSVLPNGTARLAL